MSSLSANQNRDIDPPVVIFDGICVLCNRTISTLMTLDRNRILKFTPNTSKTAKQLLQQYDLEGTEQQSLLFFDGRRVLTKSDAVFAGLALLPLPYSLLGWGRCIPRFIRNVVYDCVAASRYKMFGRAQNCALLTPEQRSRIIE